jgi:DNA-binding NtrC family response regulator
MSIQGVLFCHGGKSHIQRVIDSPAALREEVGAWLRPAAVVVRDEDLELFRERAELFKDCHKKDERKGLSEYLLGQNKTIPLIDADYTDFGRLKLGIETLLQNAEEAGERGIYVLGVGGEHFLKIWSEALPEDALFRNVSHGNGLAAMLPSLPGEAKLSRDFWGDTEDYHEVRQLILYAARIKDPVLIMGETGSGKELAAKAIHELGPQNKKDKPFVAVNCAMIPSELFEAVVFGYEAGALPGGLAIGKAGLWEEAKDGTLFLDEIGYLRPDHQVKILHILKDGFIWHVGALTHTQVFARVIASTSRDLYGMMQREKFNKDLYYRLRQFLIRTPDLRGNIQNVEVIAQKLWREITGSDAVLPEEIVEELCLHRWPGNVRELRSVLSSLYNFFGASDLTRKKLNGVFQHFGLAAGYTLSEPDAGEPALLQMECVRMISRADDTIHACEIELQPLAGGHPLSAAARESLTRLRLELRALLRKRLNFGSKETYQSVAQVEESLGQLLELPKNKTSEQSNLWKKLLAPEIQQAVSLLFTEHQKLRDLLGARA